jgi:hypothetical protein
MTIQPGELIRVTRPDKGDGWMEGVNETRGTQGLFPSGYVMKE